MNDCPNTWLYAINLKPMRQKHDNFSVANGVNRTIFVYNTYSYMRASNMHYHPYFRKKDVSK